MKVTKMNNIEKIKQYLEDRQSLISTQKENEIFKKEKEDISSFLKTLEEVEKLIKQLEAELDIAKSFHKLAVKERDFERLKNSNT